MMRKLFCLCMCLGAAFAQTPLDEPIQQTVTEVGALLTAIDNAQEHVFAVTPQLPSSDLAEALARARARGVRVYLVVQKQASYPPEVTGLVQQGIDIRTLPSLAEGVLVTNYRYLFEGGFVSGADKPTQYLDIDGFGSTFIAQFRALWQAAEPLGG